MLPGALYFTLLFVFPMLGLIAMSFFTPENFDFVPDFQIGNYLEVITSEINKTLFVRTVRLSAIVTGVVLLISFPLAYVINFVFRERRQFLYFLILGSLFGGFLVRIYAWRSILGREGIINATLEGMGVIDEPLRWLLNSQFAVGLSLVNFLIPIAVLPIYSSMQNVSPSLIEAARDLGASRLRVARQIVLPLSMRGVRAAAAFVFVATMGEWVTPTLLGGPRDQLIGNRIQFHFGGDFNWPEGAALAILLIAAMIVSATIIMKSMMRLAK